MGKRLIIIVSIVLVAAAGVTTFVVIARVRAARQAFVIPAPTSQKPVDGSGTQTPPVTQAPVSTPPKGILPREQDAPPVLPESAAKDTDGDGLIDIEEIAVGSSSQKKDTDGDGLSDFDEVRSYCTDPAEVSTDGKTQDKAWVEARKAEASAAGQRPSFCVN